MFASTISRPVPMLSTTVTRSSIVEISRGMTSAAQNVLASPIVVAFLRALLRNQSSCASPLARATRFLAWLTVVLSAFGAFT